MTQISGQVAAASFRLRIIVFRGPHRAHAASVIVTT